MTENLTSYQRTLRRAYARADAEKHEATFSLHASAYGLPHLEVNYKFDQPESQMELDFAHVPTKVGVEIQGGIANHKARMGHSTPRGITRDIKKNNAAQMKGWLLLQLTPDMVTDGTGALLVKRAIEIRGASS